MNIDKGEKPGQVTLTRTDKEEARRGEDPSVQTAEGGARHKEGHRPVHYTQHAVAKGL